MATVTISFDTKEKSLSVSMDGKKMEDVSGVSFYQSYDEKDEYHMCVTTSKTDEDADIQTYQSVCAKEDIKIVKGSLAEQLSTKLLGK